MTTTLSSALANNHLIYNGNSVCPSVWAVPGKFFQALPVILLLLLLAAAADLSVNDFLNVSV
jgi:hypothetical protein